jgi:hypothetical protein
MASMAGSKGGISKLFQKKLIKISLKKVRCGTKKVVNLVKNKEEN